MQNNMGKNIVSTRFLWCMAICTYFYHRYHVNQICSQKNTFKKNKPSNVKVSCRSPIDMHMMMGVHELYNPPDPLTRCSV